MKELYIQIHNELIELYLEKHPDASEETAYEETIDMIHDVYVDRLADYIDQYHDQYRDKMIEIRL